LNWIEQVKALTEAITQASQPQERLQLLSELKQNLMAVRDRIIGNSCCKYFFVRNGLLPALTPLLWLKDESSAEFTRLLMDCQRDALTLLAVLIAQSGNVIMASPGEEAQLFSNLLALLQSAKEVRFLEILTRSLCNFVRKVESLRGVIFEASTLTVLLSYLEGTGRGAAYSSAVTQNVCAILAAGCDAEGKSRVLLSARVLPQLLALLSGSICVSTSHELSSSNARVGVSDLKVLEGSVELLGALTRDCQEACEAVSCAPVAGRRIPNSLFSLLNMSLLSVELKLKISLL
jgi:hypothetical protein